MYEIRNRQTGKVIAQCPNSENARKVFNQRYLEDDTHGIFKITSVIRQNRSSAKIGQMEAS